MREAASEPRQLADQQAGARLQRSQHLLDATLERTLKEPMNDDDPFLTSLLYEDEGSTLDFKREQYTCATDEQKGELIKDILAFTNAWRHAEAYILIGVAETPGSYATVIGVTDHLKDADLQQLVNSKTNQPVTFSYRSVRLDGKSIGVLHIPVQDRPRFITRRFGKLSADTVYLRRGSSTAVARPDEIARSGHRAHPTNVAGPPDAVC